MAFQEAVSEWMFACFGQEISGDVQERCHRFLEEALELVQSKGCTASEARQLVDYVFNRSVGDPIQEVGGVMVTIAALCSAIGLSMDAAGELELERVWTKIDKIREKQAAKPKHSPLPASDRPMWQRLSTPGARVRVLPHVRDYAGIKGTVIAPDAGKNPAGVEVRLFDGRRRPFTVEGEGCELELIADAPQKKGK
jgi:hypothetical protein